MSKYTEYNTPYNFHSLNRYVMKQIMLCLLSISYDQLVMIKKRPRLSNLSLG